MKLLVTGGHVTPALACIDAIRAQSLPIEIVFVGRRFAHETDRKPTFEYSEITAREIPFYHLEAGRLSRIISIQSLLHLMKIPQGFWQSWKLLKQLKPDCILSFGGYLAVPIAIAAWMRRIPVYTHEQTIHPGLANKLIGHFARKIFISFPETAEFFPATKVMVTGNPIRNNVFETIRKPFELEKDHPVIYITGGSLGAHSINVHIEHILPELLKKYIVIHQSGNVAQYHDFDRLKKLKKSLSEKLQHRYFLVAHFMADEVGYIFNQSDLVISRSGANTFFELAALHKPAIFIPLPWAAHSEQQKHAEIFVKEGVGEIFSQYHSSEELLKLIHASMKRLDQYADHFKTFPTVYVQQAAETIIATISQS